MSYEPVKRNNYNDPDPQQLVNHVSKYHSDDVQDFHIPLERMHHSNLHDWGIARGLEVSGTIGNTEIVVSTGVAIDKSGQLISLSSIADIGENPPEGESNETIVDVHISTENYAGKTVYVTIQFFEKLRDNDGVLGRWEQVPWVRLQPVDAYDGKSIVLAVAVFKEAGKLAELKTMDNNLPHRRRLIGECIEELRIKRSSKIGNEVQDIPSGKLGPGERGGLKVTVPNSQDSILFAREDGDDFSNLEIRANVGVGIFPPSEKLEVNGKVKATAFIGDGSAITALNGEKITTGIIADPRIPSSIARESLFDPASGHKHTGTVGDGPKILHSNLDSILPAKTTSTDSTLTKHVSDALAKGWQDHINIISGNPHGTTAAQLSDYLAKKFQALIKFTNSDNDGATRTVNVGFIPKLIMISGGFSATLGSSNHGCSLSSYWSPEFLGGTHIGLSKYSPTDIQIYCSSSPNIFSYFGLYLNGSIGMIVPNYEIINGSISFSAEGIMTMTINRAQILNPDPIRHIIFPQEILNAFDISLSMLCIG